jgi:hypothetical protein
MHPRQLIIGTFNKRDSAGNQRNPCLDNPHPQGVVLRGGDHFTMPRGNRTIPNPDRLILDLPIQSTRPGGCA